MWKELQTSPPFFLLFLIKCKYHILITNYIRIWELYFTEDEFLNCLKESNFGLEINTHELIDKGTQMLLNPKDLKSLNISSNESFLTVHITKFYGYPLHLKFKLGEGSCELFFQEITQKLLYTVKDLRCSEQELREMLLKKDKEIDEYKSLAGPIRFTALPAYNDETHIQKHSVYDNNFGEMEISNSLLERKVDVSRINAFKEDMDCKKIIKQEPVSQEVCEITADRLNEIKQESIKNEIQPLVPTRTKKKKMLNI